MVDKAATEVQQRVDEVYRSESRRVFATLVKVLGDFELAHAARADLCRRLGRTAEARESYERAAAQAKQDPERRFLEGRLRELD